MKIAFIGCGNMGGALATAVSKSQVAKQVLLCDKNVENAKKLATSLGAVYADSKTVCEQSDYLFLGVKPQFLASLIEEISPFIKKREQKPVIITMLAGVKIEKIKNYLGNDVKVIRIMPNTPVGVQEGMVLYTKSEDVTTDNLNDFLSFMQKAGKLDMLDEEFFDAGSALSGCGPAFVYLFIDALTEGGINCGLTKEQAQTYAKQTLLGASKLATVSSKTPNELKIDVCSPGGSTIEGVKILEDGAFKSAVVSAVKASFERTKELGK